MQEITPPPKVENSTIKLVCRRKLAGLRENLHPWERNIAIGVAGIGKQPAGEHGAFRALSAFAAAKLAGTECSNCRMGSGWVRSSLESHERDIGKLCGASISFRCRMKAPLLVIQRSNHGAKMKLSFEFPLSRRARILSSMAGLVVFRQQPNGEDRAAWQITTAPDCFGWFARLPARGVLHVSALRFPSAA